jgi:Recombinase
LPDEVPREGRFAARCAQADTLRDIRETGITSANGIAAELNRRGVTTPRGGRWQAWQVQRILALLR